MVPIERDCLRWEVLSRLLEANKRCQDPPRCRARGSELTLLQFPQHANMIGMHDANGAHGVFVRQQSLVFFGGILGVLSAVILFTLSPFSLSAEAVTIAFVASWELSLKAFSFSIAGALAAGAVPAWVAARHAPLSALQEG